MRAVPVRLAHPDIHARGCCHRRVIPHRARAARPGWVPFQLRQPDARGV